jgi:demethylmenaquinone methyltransferase/2-methoxy-6-polyprenyl-1,4-benzoquinol methylase
MSKQSITDIKPVPVKRTKTDAAKFYDRISGVYDLLSGHFEEKFTNQAISELEICDRARALEIGFGTGKALVRIAKAAKLSHEIYGIDISTRMIEVSSIRLRKAGLAERVQLLQGEASKLPFGSRYFDIAFLSFTLELFDNPEIPKLLSEIKRVLKPGGHIGIVSLSLAKGRTNIVHVYEWLHNHFPTWLDCRPILVEKSLKDCGYQIHKSTLKTLMGLPIEIVVASS